MTTPSYDQAYGRSDVYFIVTFQINWGIFILKHVPYMFLLTKVLFLILQYQLLFFVRVRCASEIGVALCSGNLQVAVDIH